MTIRATQPAIACLTVAVGALLVGCAGPAPSHPPRTPSAVVSPSPSAVAPSIGGLLIATSGPLAISDDVGDVSAMDPPVPAVAVSAGGQTILAVAETGELAVSMRDTNPRAWTALELPRVTSGVRLFAVAPDGDHLASLAGEPAGSSFDLTIRDLVTGHARSHGIRRGLNGPPAWLGPSLVVVDAIGPDGSSGLIEIDPTTGIVRDDPGPGTIIAASADGSRIAVDDPVTGWAFVGSADAWRARGLDGLVRLDEPAGTSAEALAMSADGGRLAIVRQSETAGAIDILVEVDGAWRLVRSIPLAAGIPASIAWAR